MATKTTKGRAKRKPADAFEEDFGPGPGEPPEPPRAGGPIPGIACAGEGCVLKPVADLIGRFTLKMARGHGGSLVRAAFSGLELMKALRDFLDEEIALAERAAGKNGAGARRSYVKIAVD